MIISPTIGRVVWYWPSAHDLSDGKMRQYADDQAFDAHVTFVWSDTEVNLVVFDHEGTMSKREHVSINLAADKLPRAEWMPYQQKQAEKAAAETAPDPNPASPPSTTPKTIGELTGGANGQKT